VLDKIELQSSRNDSVGTGEDWGVREFDQFHWPPPIDLQDLKVGIPNEFNVEELSEATRKAWLKGIRWLRESGATIFEVSLPHIPMALSAYYVLASAEAVSNLSRYDGLRYGFNQSAYQNSSGRLTEATKESLESITEDAMEGFQELDDHSGYKATYRENRSQGFGREVKRRLMVGNYVLSENARGEYFDAANELRQRLQRDFDNVFRQGVHVLLAPTTPSEPWLIDESSRIDPVSMYANDVLTAPINLSSLPSINVPIGMSKSDANKPPFPTGLQVIGRPNGEAVMAWAAAAVERQAQFSLRYPHYID
jgi:aspartyl-tRNA(Asn)/glutamyl-tRNA(Gln) amidotransferase subunit A